MIEVIRHTSGYSGSQESSSADRTLLMDASPLFSHSMYETPHSGHSMQMIVAAADALRQLPSTSAEHDTKVKMKRSNKKEKPGRREKIPEGTLCVVCSDLASGIHYSVASCNGCKTFFRRALVNKQAFQCQFSDDCVVDKSVRCGCRSCRLKKCFQMGMNPNAIQHDRDKIRYTKRALKVKEEGPLEVSDITNGKAGFMKEEVEDSPQSNQSPDDLANMSSPSSSFAGQGPGSNGPVLDNEIHDIQAEMSGVLSELLLLERKLNDVRCANRFPAHKAAAGCVLERRLLDDDTWLSTYSKPLSPVPSVTAIPCDRENLRAWFVKDLTLMIEWAKCLTQMGSLLLNDKMSLIKAFAPIFPLIQLAYYSCTNESCRRSSTHSPIDEALGSPSGISSITGRLSLDSNSGADLSSVTRFCDKTPTLDRLWYPDGRYLEREDLETNGTTSGKDLPINALLIDGVCHQMLRLRLTESHMVLYKLMLFFNPNADGLTSTGKALVGTERIKALNYLYVQIAHDRTGRQGTELYSNILMMTTTLTRLATLLKRTFDLERIFWGASSDDLIDQLIMS